MISKWLECKVNVRNTLPFDICHLNLSTFRECCLPFCSSKVPYTAKHLVGQRMSIQHSPTFVAGALGGPSKEAIFRLQPCLLLICGHKRGTVAGGVGVIRGGFDAICCIFHTQKHSMDF